MSDSRPFEAALVAAAMNACDAWSDGPEAREAMRRQCLAMPEHLRPDLLEHLRQTYPEDRSDDGRWRGISPRAGPSGRS